MYERTTAVAISSALLLAACGEAEEREEPEMAPAEDSIAVVEGLSHAVAELFSTAGNEAQGTVTFTFDPNFPGADVEANVIGLSPGPHGFHIHEFGDCGALDASAAGGHFNPHGDTHGSPDNAVGERHVGDLGNLDADSAGVAVYSRHDQLLTLEMADAIVGKTVIVHEGADDFETQPDGNAGARIACGVIKPGEVPPM